MFTFDAVVSNEADSAITFDAWTMVILPNGMFYGPLVRRNRLVIPSGTSIMRTLTQTVPGYAPAGVYTYKGYVGVYPDSVVADDDFEFTKLAGDASPVHNLGWACYGWFGDDEAQIANQESQIANLAASPNPFNQQTDVRYQLQAASLIKLAVFDITGREMAVLAEGFYPAGLHQAELDASAMSSGIYFLRLQAGDFNLSRKLLLVK